MTALVAGLLAWAALLMHVPVPAEPPVVVVRPQAELAAAHCGRPCPVLGSFAPDANGQWGITLADSVDLETVRGRSVLVHELVHYLQHAARGPAVTCAEALAREREAYGVQATYVARHGELWGMGLASHTLRCGDQGAAAGREPMGHAHGAGSRDAR